MIPAESRRRLLLAALFTLSGASGIAYEVLWVRVFTLLAGSGVQSVSAVVSAFLLGLAVGGAVGGRVADRVRRPLLLYAGLELLVGVLHLAAFGAFELIDPVYQALWGTLPWSALRWLSFALAGLFVTLPAALVGATLPALLRHLSGSQPEAAASAGRLCALNTLGAGAGALWLVTKLLPWAGYLGSLRLAAALSVGLGLVALALGRRAPLPVAAPPPVTGSGATPLPAWLVLGAYAVTGACALGYQVLWSRTLEFVFRGTLQSFGYLLLLFLSGLATGNLLGALALSREADPRALFGLASLGAALVSWLTLVLLCTSGLGVWLVPAILAVTALGGLTFPAALQLRLEGGSLFGRSLGDAYSWNTGGSIAGALLVGFVGIPWVGGQATWSALVALHLVAGAAVLARARRRLAWAGLGTGCALVGLSLALLPADGLRRAGYPPPLGQVVFTHEGAEGIVAVLENQYGDRRLYGGPHVSGSTGRRLVQTQQGHLAMLLHPRPRRVLEIGYGVGEILRAALAHQPERVDLIEIDPAMIPCANEQFALINQRSSEHPAVQLHLMDGRQFLARSERRWDVIVSDTFILRSELSTRLYTLEHFRHGAAHLAPGGYMVAWLPVEVGDQRVLTACATFAAVFPHVLAWRTERTLLLLGALEPLQVSLAGLRARWGAARDDLELCGLTGPEALLMGFCLDGPGLRGALEGIAPHRDLAPTLDFAPLDDYDPQGPLNRALAAGGPECLLPCLPAQERPLVGALAARHRLAREAHQLARRELAPPTTPDWALDLSVGQARAARAFQGLQLALAIDPGAQATRLLAARLACHQGLEQRDPRRAGEWFRLGLTAHPWDAPCTWGLARTCWQTNDQAGLRAQMQRLARSHPYLRSPDLVREP